MNYLKNTFNEANIPLTDEQCSQFERYYTLLTERNKVMNLTAITEYEEVMRKHFLDSSMLFALPEAVKLLPEEPTVIDVGTGAGFPGLPLKIVRPEIRLFLLDALQKRIDFLDEVVTTLDLRDAELCHGRAEDAAREETLRERFDLAVSRAVANLSVLSEYCLPFVKTGGYFAAYKSGKVDEEIAGAENALKILGGEVANVLRFTLHGTTEERSIVLIRKIAETSSKYPRKAGKPVKNPL